MSFRLNIEYRLNGCCNIYLFIVWLFLPFREEHRHLWPLISSFLDILRLRRFSGSSSVVTFWTIDDTRLVTCDSSQVQYILCSIEHFSKCNLSFFYLWIAILEAQWAHDIEYQILDWIPRAKHVIFVILISLRYIQTNKCLYQALLRPDLARNNSM